MFIAVFFLKAAASDDRRAYVKFAVKKRGEWQRW